MLSLFAIIVGVGAGVLLAMQPNRITEAVGPCPYTCQASATKSASSGTCTPPGDKASIKKKHDDYQKKKNSKDPKEKAEAQKLKAELKQCAEDLNSCNTASFPGGSRSTCDKDPGKGLPKGSGEKPKDDKGGEGKGDKPPEAPKIPEIPKKPPGEPPKEQPKNESCPPPKTPEECAKEQGRGGWMDAVGNFLSDPVKAVDKALDAAASVIYGPDNALRDTTDFGKDPDSASPNIPPAGKTTVSYKPQAGSSGDTVKDDLDQYLPQGPKGDTPESPVAGAKRDPITGFTPPPREPLTSSTYDAWLKWLKSLF